MWAHRRWACERGHHRIVAQLLGEDPLKDTETRRELDRKNSTLYPLHLAVLSGSAETLQVLLDAGFNVHRRRGGQSLLALAIKLGRLGALEVITSSSWCMVTVLL